jgi:hypothetical protein
MLSKIALACVGALTLLPDLAFAAETANRLPSANIESMCQDAQSAVLPESEAAAYQSCANDERAAFDQLRQKWARYPTAARVTCAEPAGVPISYVELQTCLDMQPGGRLTFEGPAPGVAPSLDTMRSPTPAARSRAGSNDRGATRVVVPMQTEQSLRRVAPYPAIGASTP